LNSTALILPKLPISNTVDASEIPQKKNSKKTRGKLWDINYQAQLVSEFARFLVAINSTPSGFLNKTIRKNSTFGDASVFIFFHVDLVATWSAREVTSDFRQFFRGYKMRMTPFQTIVLGGSSPVSKWFSEPWLGLSSPFRIGQHSPSKWLKKIGVILTTYVRPWDDPPRLGAQLTVQPRSYQFQRRWYECIFI